MTKSLVHLPFDSKGIFVSRENRFLGKVRLKDTDSVVKVHVRDPGRLEEILYEGNEVLLEKAESDDRKTDWTLLAGKVKDDWILVNSGYHRKISESILNDQVLSPFGEIEGYEAEKKLGDSRIDFSLQKNEGDIWVEVKGCTLAEEEIALFPDAPTKRGKRHVEELIRANEAKDTSAALLFLVFRPDARCFSPYEKQDPDFSKSFEKALEEGVEVHAIQLEYDGSDILYKGEIPICEDDKK